jgi:hypothetical protein
VDLHVYTADWWRLKILRVALTWKTGLRAPGKVSRRVHEFSITMNSIASTFLVRKFKCWQCGDDFSQIYRPGELLAQTFWLWLVLVVETACSSATSAQPINIINFSL